jgi:hypothetical protein
MPPAEHVVSVTRWCAALHAAAAPMPTPASKSESLCGTFKRSQQAALQSETAGQTWLVLNSKEAAGVCSQALCSCKRVCILSLALAQVQILVLAKLLAGWPSPEGHPKATTCCMSSSQKMIVLATGSAAQTDFHGCSSAQHPWWRHYCLPVISVSWGVIQTLCF